MVIPYQDPELPWWHGRGMFRMIHEMYTGEYLRKRDVDDKRNTGLGYIPSSTGVVGFWVSKDGLVMSATEELTRFVLVGMEPSDKEFFDKEVPADCAGTYWGQYSRGYWLREIIDGELSEEWTWMRNPAYAGFMPAGLKEPAPAHPDVGDEFLAQALRFFSEG